MSGDQGLTPRGEMAHIMTSWSPERGSPAVNLSPTDKDDTSEQNFHELDLHVTITFIMHRIDEMDG